MRPVLPGDKLLLRRGFARLSPTSIFHRFHGHLRSLPDDICRALTEIDYDSHMALVALEPGYDVALGVARYCLQPDDDLAEAAIVVMDEWQSRGIGRSLLDVLIAAARERGIAGFQGRVLCENHRMMRFVRHLGYVVHVERERGVVLIRHRFDEKAWWS